jgi:hypothetical protein
MNKVILDEPLRSKLNGLNEKVELCDESGNTLALVLPYEQYWRLQLAADGYPYSYEEFQRSRAETGGRPLEDIWKTLGR